MSRLQDDLLKLLDEMAQARDTRERVLARELIRLYEEARRELHLQFLEQHAGTKQHAGTNTIRLEQIDSIMRDIERQIGYYTQKAAGIRTTALEGAFGAGRDIGLVMLSSGPVKAGLSLSLGRVNRGMIEALTGDSLKRVRAIEQPLLLRIREELVKGAIMGESIPKIGRRILGTGITQEGLKKPFPSLKARCETIARTEIVRASSAGYIDTADRMQSLLGEEIYSAWVTAGDDRVDPPCPQLAQGTDSRFKSVEGMPGVYRRTNLPVPTVASHPRCRCRLLPVLRSWVTSGEFKLEELRGHRPAAEIEGQLRKEAEWQQQRQAEIRNGKYQLRVNQQKQNRHIEGTKEAEEYAAKLAAREQRQSMLSADPAELVKKYAGKGYVVNPQSANPPKERIVVDKVIGRYYNKVKREYEPTNAGMIVYSKTGVHVYPVRPQ